MVRNWFRPRAERESLADIVDCVASRFEVSRAEVPDAVAYAAQHEQAQADEIERLRARVAELEDATRHAVLVLSNLGAKSADRISDAHVQFGGFQSIGGEFNPGAAKTHLQLRRPIPHEATVVWRETKTLSHR